MELFLLYLWMKLDTLGVALIVLMTLTGVFGVGGWLWATDGDYRCPRSLRIAYWKPKFYRRVIPLFLTLGFLITIIPTQTQTAVLVAGHYALKMANTPEASKVMSVLRKKANEYLDEQLADKVTK